jgi:hypothetical protein
MLEIKRRGGVAIVQALDDPQRRSKKVGKLEALRQAQLRMLCEYDPQQKKLVSRGLDIPAGPAIGPARCCARQ